MKDLAAVVGTGFSDERQPIVQAITWRSAFQTIRMSEPHMKGTQLNPHYLHKIVGRIVVGSDKLSESTHGCSHGRTGLGQHASFACTPWSRFRCLERIKRLFGAAGEHTHKCPNSTREAATSKNVTSNETSFGLNFGLSSWFEPSGRV